MKLGNFIRTMATVVCWENFETKTLLLTRKRFKELCRSLVYRSLHLHDTTEFKYYELDSKGHMTMHKLYLDPFMDMCNGEILSFGIDKHPSAENVLVALEKAIKITSDCPY